MPKRLKKRKARRITVAAAKVRKLNGSDPIKRYIDAHPDSEAPTSHDPETLQTIAERFGINANTVRNRLVSAGFKRPGKRWQWKPKTAEFESAMEAVRNQGHGV